MLKITDDNYEYYKEVFIILWQFKAKEMIHVDPDVEHSPVIILTNWEKKNKSIAKRGLKEGLRDILTMLIDLPNGMQAQLSEQLVNRGFPSFYNLTVLIKDSLKKVLKRKKIKSLDEYYVVKEFLDDSTSNILNEDRQQLETMFHEFESKYSEKN